MGVQVKEWVQREWKTPGVSLYRVQGDYEELYGLRATWDKRQLQRGPGWSAIVEFPVSGSDHIKSVRGAFYDAVSSRVVFIGHWYDGSNNYIGSCYADSSWIMSGPFTLITTNYEMGSLDGRNFCYWGGDLYVIDASRNVFRASGYTGGMGAAFYAGTDAWALAPMGDRMYMATYSLTTGGMIYRLNDADNAFELYFDPVGVIDFVFMAGFRGYMAIVAQREDGTLDIYRLPDSNPALHHIAQLPAETADRKYYGCPFGVYNDRLYLCPGRYTNPDGTHVVDIYEFNGSTLRRVARLPSESASPDSFGLLNWRGELLYYEVTSPGATATFAIKMLSGDKFDNFAPVAVTSLGGVNAAVFAVGGQLMVTTRDTEEGICHHTGLQDGYVITAWLDMASPGRLKVLERITCLLDGRATDFKVLLKYRTDDNAGWTTAVTANNTRRATVSNLGVEFYQVQLRVDLDDDMEGTVWSGRAAAEANGWRGVTWGNGLFVAVAEDGTSRVMSSPDGITWTARGAAESNGWAGVTYGNGLFVAVAYDGISRVMSSPDGITWTARGAAEANEWVGVTYGNGLFVAVAGTGTNRVMTSPDGISWTARAAAEANGWLDIGYGNGLFVAVAYDGSNRVMTSPDGITWTARGAAEGNEWIGVTYGNGLFVAVARTGTNRVMTSPDGISWRARAAAEANEWFDIGYGNGLFVAVAYDGSNRVMTSPDGISWIARAAPGASGWRGVIYANGLFVAVAGTGTSRVMTSPQGDPDIRINSLSVVYKE